MTITNQKLISEVFDALVKFKPGPNKYRELDDEDEDINDFRLLGDHIIKNFPWPVGVELRRLFSASAKQLDRLRLDQIFKTIERTMQLSNAIMISQLWKECRSGKVVIPDFFRAEFEKRLSLLTMGSFTWFIRAIAKIFNDNNIQWFMPEMAECLKKEFCSALDFWVPERNEIGHYQATNESNWSGLPGGFRNENGHYSLIGIYGTWWSGTETSAIRRELECFSD